MHIRFGEMHSWILYWNNWTLSKDPKQEQTRTDLWLKYYGPMDRTLLEQERADVFEEAFKDFPLAHVLFHKLDRGKSGSIAKLWQELLTEFPLDKKRVTFEYLARVIYSAQPMSVNTDKEYTSYLSNVHEVTETLVQVTFNVKEVMFLMEMTNFQQSDHKVHKKIWTSMEEMLDEADDNDIPMDDIRKKNIKIFTAQGKPNKLHAFKTTITGKKMSDCYGCPVHCVNFDGTWRDIDPRVIHDVKASKTRAFLTGVESGDLIDPEGNLVSLDDDFSRTC